MEEGIHQAQLERIERDLLELLPKPRFDLDGDELKGDSDADTTVVPMASLTAPKHRHPAEKILPLPTAFPDLRSGTRRTEGHMIILKYLNLSLLVLFPVAWFAPLMRAGFLPLFGLNEITVVSGLQSLWKSDVILALLVTGFALFAPYLKTIGLALIHFGLMRRKVLPALAILGKLAMADVFLIAIYIVLVRGIGIGKVETGWGLYLFTACILASIYVSWATARKSEH